MKKIEISWDTLGSAILSIITYLIGGFDSLIIALFIFIILDYLTGICKAIVKKKVSSRVSIKGIIKKFGYLFIVMIATIFDYLVDDENMALRTLTIYFFIANEALSILENWSSIGLPLPKKLFEVFEKIKEEDNIKN